MSRSSAAELAQRIDTVYNLLLRGVSRAGISSYAANHGWQVSPRQLDTYSARARAELVKAAEHNRALELGRTKERLELLFLQAMTSHDNAEARAVVHEQIELLGLAAAQRHELSGPAGMPLPDQAELAAQVRLAIETKAARFAEQGKGSGDGLAG